VVFIHWLCIRLVDYSNLSSENIEKRVSPDHEEEPIATGSSTPETQNINGDGVVSFAASAEEQVNIGKDVSNLSKSPSFCDNKSDYSSMVGCLACLLLFFHVLIFCARNCGLCLLIESLLVVPNRSGFF
jgi:hypothetical protein